MSQKMEMKRKRHTERNRKREKTICAKPVCKENIRKTFHQYICICVCVCVFLLGLVPELKIICFDRD